ncbi:hypothetical protein EV193_107177 [Herbihabitans rhizosphaerae]|uniref:Uncharacterized protein n=1 Tax=Herbihabitans rhizosphaerae TaxID=1872711 RepID=A0A4Q7KJX0_9PSEU|nr:hypothetical protein [Herbihabitans rhizosphaerae]RZS36496.1 hypothetical protein EV193_107177 [Herbihabitans rhizosphaerae]
MSNEEIVVRQQIGDVLNEWVEVEIAGTGSGRPSRAGPLQPRRCG